MIQILKEYFPLLGLDLIKIYSKTEIEEINNLKLESDLENNETPFNKKINKQLRNYQEVILNYGYNYIINNYKFF